MAMEQTIPVHSMSYHSLCTFCTEVHDGAAPSALPANMLPVTSTRGGPTAVKHW